MDYCCSFCGKPRAEVRTLVSGPSVFICDECILLCLDVLEEQGIAIPRRQKSPAPKKRQPQPASQRLADIILWCRESLSLQQLWPPSAGREDRAELLPKELLAPGGPLDQRPVHVFEVSDIGLQISQILSGGVRMIGTVRNSASLKSANFVGEDGWLVVCEFDPPR